MAVTIREVAHHADVSIATVSRALRGHSSVSPVTRERVEAAAAELGYTLPYRPETSNTSRALRVGVIMPYIGRWYFSRVLAGIESALGDRESNVIIFRPFDRQGRRRDFLDILDPAVLDAAIIVTLAVSDREVDACRERGISLSLLGTTYPGVPNVRIDDVAACRTLTQHFIDYGHTRIGYVGNQTFDAVPRQVSEDRQLGYHQAHDANGLSIEKDLVVKTDFSITGASRAVDKLLSLANPPTAIVAESDELAFGVITAAQAHGLRIPGDVSVGGIDDHDVSEALGLTTIAQPVDSLGEVAAWQAIAGAEATASVEMPTSLIIRASSLRI